MHTTYAHPTIQESGSNIKSSTNHYLCRSAPFSVMIPFMHTKPLTISFQVLNDLPLNLLLMVLMTYTLFATVFHIHSPYLHQHSIQDAKNPVMRLRAKGFFFISQLMVIYRMNKRIQYLLERVYTAAIFLSIPWNF